MQANRPALEAHNGRPPTSITDRVRLLQQRGESFKRQDDFTIELSIRPAHRTLDPHTQLSQHEPNHRIESGFDSR
jgi:hypothetical protein